MTVSVAVLGFFDCWDGWLIISLSEKLLSKVAFNFRVGSFKPCPGRFSRAPQKRDCIHHLQADSPIFSKASAAEMAAITAASRLNLSLESPKALLVDV